jgi:hypothetical protein
MVQCHGAYGINKNAGWLAYHYQHAKMEWNMKPYYYVMRCIIHGDSALVAVGISGERDVHWTQMNTGVFKFFMYHKKLRLEPWARQSGFIGDDSGKIEFK